MKFHQDSQPDGECFAKRDRARDLLILLMMLALIHGMALPARGDEANEFQSLSETFQSEWTRIHGPLQTTFRGYVKRLQNLRERATASGVLARVQALDEALSEAKEKGYSGRYEVSPALARSSPELAEAKSLLVRELEKRRRQSIPEAERLMTAYISRLDQLERMLTKKQRLEEALLVRDERFRVGDELASLRGLAVGNAAGEGGLLIGGGVWFGEPFEIAGRHRNHRFTKVVASNLNWLALREDGTVVTEIPKSTEAWNWEMAVVPPGLDSVVDICVTNSSNHALRANGELVVWGKSSLPQVRETPIEVLKDIVEFGAGWAYGAALNRDGNLFTWGAIVRPPPECSTHVRRIVTTSGRLYVFSESGKVYSIDGRAITELPIDGDEVLEASAGRFHMVVRMKSGKIRGFGKEVGAWPVPPDRHCVRVKATRFYRDFGLLSNGSWLAWDVPGPSPVNPVFDAIEPEKCIDFDGIIHDNPTPEGQVLKTHYFVAIQRGR